MQKTLPDWMITDVYGFHALMAANKSISAQLLELGDFHTTYGLPLPAQKLLRISVNRQKELIIDQNTD